MQIQFTYKNCAGYGSENELRSVFFIIKNKYKMKIEKTGVF